MNQRHYKTTSRAKLAIAYGFSKQETIMNRIKQSIHRLTDEELTELGQFTGCPRLLPAQVKIIVSLLGEPENPQMLYE
jgi:hypothetical protein